jgi:hypothetical protein
MLFLKLHQQIAALLVHITEFYPIRALGRAGNPDFIDTSPEKIGRIIHLFPYHKIAGGITVAVPFGIGRVRWAEGKIVDAAVGAYPVDVKILF